VSARTLYLPDRVHDYLVANSVHETAEQRALRAETAKLPSGGMQISPEQGQLLGVLVKLIGAEHCIEVGTFTGYSALCVALALPDSGRIVCCDVSEQWTAIARRFWEKAGVAKKIDLKLAPALETLDALLADRGASRYDFAFIDADKTGYTAYYERCLKLLRAGGLIAVDNTLWSGEVADPSVIDASTVALRAFNRMVYEDPRVDASLVTIGDGLTLARKK
jgi:predicted O-methyltransferase YrrM